VAKTLTGTSSRCARDATRWYTAAASEFPADEMVRDLSDKHGVHCGLTFPPVVFAAPQPARRDFLEASSHFRNCWLCVLILPWRRQRLHQLVGLQAGRAPHRRLAVRRSWRFQISNNAALVNLSPRRDCKSTSAIQQIPACPTQVPSELGWEFSLTFTCSLLWFPGGMARTICRLFSARSTWRRPFPFAFCRRKSRPASACR